MKKRIILSVLLTCLILSTAAAQGRETARGHINEGQAHLQAGRLDEAVASFEAALRLEPRNRQAPSLLLEAQTARVNRFITEAQRFSHAGNFEEAVEQYDLALQAAPDGFNTRQIIDAKTAALTERTNKILSEAQRLRREGNFDEALEMYDRAIQSAPNEYITYRITNARIDMHRERTNQLFAEGKELHWENNFTEAIARFDAALATAPAGYNTRDIEQFKTDSERAIAEALLQSAGEAIAAGNYTEALTLLQSAVGTGRLDQYLTSRAQDAITILQDLPNRQASYNRAVREDDFEIRQLPNSVAITNYKASENINIIIGYSTKYNITIGILNVVIPNKLFNLPVTEIGGDAFREKNLTSVTLPNTLLTIGVGAFSHNRNLTTIVIPNSVTIIEGAAFADCGLTTVTLGNTVNSIGGRAFANNRLTSITFPASVRTIEGRAFENNQLTSVTVPNGVTLLGGDPNPFTGNPLTTIVIPASFTDSWNHGIGGVFPDTLTRVTLPANVDDSNMRAFDGGLQNFYIGQNRRAGTYVKNGPVWTRQ
ncbi:MAG: leucine-rich repeat protein [Treponema sp.]|nr:leucine-rich repeat protein [Treponema sp.]